MTRSTHRAADLVRGILAFGHQHEPDRHTLRLRPVVEEVLELLRATVPARIALDILFASDTPPVAADHGQLARVMNLVTNAAHAIGDADGTTNVEMYPTTVIAGDHPSGLIPPGRYATIAVVDDGAGIDPALATQIFDPFFTTKEPGEGTGLGLSVVAGIVANHDGIVTVDSEPGQGSTFTIYLPASDEPVAIAKATAESLPAATGEQVLLVDDEEILVRLTTRQLELLGYEVDEFTHPLALEAFAAHPDRYDLVVTDQSMPAMSGPELARQLHELRATIPVVLLSGFVEVPDAARAPAHIAAALPKPCTIEELGRALHDVVHPTDPLP